jgi:hypothetical protein
MVAGTKEEGMAEETPRRRAFSNLVINLVALEPGDRVRLKNEATAEVVSNPRDGTWIFLRYLESPADPALVGAEELVFADDVLELL